MARRNHEIPNTNHPTQEKTLRSTKLTPSEVISKKITIIIPSQRIHQYQLVFSQARQYFRLFCRLSVVPSVMRFCNETKMGENYWEIIG